MTQINDNQQQYIADLESGKKEKICDALLSISMSDFDWHWSQNICLQYLEHKDSDIRGLTATCLGHIARIHGELDRPLVEMKLKEKLSDPDMGGRASDAIDDIGMFLQNT